MDIYELENLENARKFFSQTDKTYIVTNSNISTKFYGMRVIDYMFKQLIKEFPNKIAKIIVNTDNDMSAYITAKRLGYKNISYSSIF